MGSKAYAAFYTKRIGHSPSAQSDELICVADSKTECAKLVVKFLKEELNKDPKNEKDVLFYRPATAEGTNCIWIADLDPSGDQAAKTKSSFKNDVISVHEIQMNSLLASDLNTRVVGNAF